MYKIVIKWGLPSSEQEPTEYKFRTIKELDAFAYGVEEASGWLEYEVIEPEEHANHVSRGRGVR